MTSFGVRSIPAMLPQWHVKHPGHSAKSSGGRLYPNTRTPLTQRSRSGLIMLSRHDVETCLENEVTRNPSLIARLQSSQPAEPLWTDPDLIGGIYVRQLITIKKQQQQQLQRKKTGKRRRGLIRRSFVQIVGCQQKATTAIGVRLSPERVFCLSSLCGSLSQQCVLFVFSLWVFISTVR